MGRTGIDTLVWLLEEAFEDDPAHSLLANLRGLRDEDWLGAPPGGKRSTADILEHVGSARWMDEGYAFGSTTLRGHVPPMVAEDLRLLPTRFLIRILVAHDFCHAREKQPFRANLQNKDH